MGWKLHKEEIDEWVQNIYHNIWHIGDRLQILLLLLNEFKQINWLLLLLKSSDNLRFLIISGAIEVNLLR